MQSYANEREISLLRLVRTPLFPLSSGLHSGAADRPSFSSLCYLSDSGQVS